MHEGPLAFGIRSVAPHRGGVAVIVSLPECGVVFDIAILLVSRSNHGAYVFKVYRMQARRWSKITGAWEAEGPQKCLALSAAKNDRLPMLSPLFHQWRAAVDHSIGGGGGERRTLATYRCLGAASRW